MRREACPRIEIRPATADDAGEILAIYRPIVERTVVSFETTVPTQDAIAERIDRIARRHAWFVCTMDGAVTGYAYTAEHRARRAYQWSTESSVYVADAARRRGVARALYDVLLDAAERQGYRTILAGIAAPNPASVALHEALGFRHLVRYARIGYKLGAWHDVDWFERTAGGDTPAAPLRPLAEILADPTFAAVREHAAARIR